MMRGNGRAGGDGSSCAPCVDLGRWLARPAGRQAWIALAAAGSRAERHLGSVNSPIPRLAYAMHALLRDVRNGREGDACLGPHEHVPFE